MAGGAFWSLPAAIPASGPWTIVGVLSQDELLDVELAVQITLALRP